MYIEKFSEEVYNLIEKIVSRTERLNGYSGRVPTIEIDLALEDIRKLYDCYLLFGEMAGRQAPVSDLPVSEEVEAAVEEEEAVEDVADRDVSEDIPEATVVEEEAEVVVAEPAMEEKHEIAPVIAEQEERVSGKEKRILADKLTKGDMKSINDIIAANMSDKSISSRMQQNPISNLKSAIGINEKFIFVYELFGGNTQKYSETIEKLNTMPGRDEAISLMEAMRNEYHWDIENMAFQKLVDMVTRRYS